MAQHKQSHRKRKRKSGLTMKQEKQVAAISANGGVVPVGLFGLAAAPHDVADRIRHAASSVPRDRAAGRTNRVGSRSSARRAAVRDFT